MSTIPMYDIHQEIFTALAHFELLNEYGDEADATPQEIEAWDNFTEELAQAVLRDMPGYELWHITGLSSEDAEDVFEGAESGTWFGRCAVTGLRGDVCKFAMVFAKPRASDAPAIPTSPPSEFDADIDS